MKFTAGARFAITLAAASASRAHVDMQGKLYKPNGKQAFPLRAACMALGATNAEINMNKSNIKEGTTIVISGKTYSSKLDAKDKLTGIPQTKLTDEERIFVEGYKE